MKQTVYLGDFRDAFNNIRPNNFSYEGLGILYEYLEECDPDMELDVIALCCDFTEMNADEVIVNYGLQDEVEGMDDHDKQEFVEGFLNYNTCLCGITSSDTFVFQDF